MSYISCGQLYNSEAVLWTSQALQAKQSRRRTPRGLTCTWRKPAQAVPGSAGVRVMGGG